MDTKESDLDSKDDEIITEMMEHSDSIDPPDLPDLIDNSDKDHGDSDIEADDESGDGEELVSSSSSDDEKPSVGVPKESKGDDNAIHVKTKTDVTVPKLTDAQLEKFREQLVSLSPDTLNKFFRDLSKLDQVNPTGKRFRSANRRIVHAISEYMEKIKGDAPS
jgi:hypothetical protein